MRDCAEAMGDGCPTCKAALKHLEALRAIVRPARRAGELLRDVAGEVLMSREDGPVQMEDMMLVCVEIEKAIGRIVKTAKISGVV